MRVLIVSSPPPGGSPLFIRLLPITGVPKSRVLVGTGAIGAGEVGGAFYASLLWSSRFLTPHFKLASDFSFSFGGCRLLNFLRGFCPTRPWPKWFLFLLLICCSPASLAEPMRVSSREGFAVFCGAFLRILPVSQDHRVRRSVRLRAGLFVAFPVEIF